MKVSRCIAVKALACSASLGLLLAACTDRQMPSSPLAGEWELQVQSTDRDPLRPQLLGGRLVFDEEIPCYCDEVSQPPEGAITGRGYLSYGRRGLGSGGGIVVGPFRRGDEADRSEEFVGLLRPGNTAEIYSVGMVGVVLSGTFAQDSIQGQWNNRNHSEKVAQGTFVMRRIAATAYTDSARSRSVRGVKRWRSGTIPVPEGKVDTAQTVEAAP